MKPLAPAAIFAMLVIGCATDPAAQRQQVADYDRAVIAAVDSLSDAIEAGIVTDPKIKHAARLAANEANAIGVKLHATHEAADRAFWLRQGTESLARIGLYVAQAKREKH